MIRLKQGIGRLIRSKTDLGVIVLADKRVITKRYGPQFLKALPTRHRVYAQPEALCQAVSEFLAGALPRPAASTESLAQKTTRRRKTGSGNSRESNECREP